MKSLATTKISSKDQIVITDEIRKAMKLSSGEHFLILAERDVIILKVVTPPSMKEFDHLIGKA